MALPGLAARPPGKYCRLVPEEDLRQIGALAVLIESRRHAEPIEEARARIVARAAMRTAARREYRHAVHALPIGAAYRASASPAASADIRLTVDRLCPRHREVIVAYFYRDMNLREVASEFKLSVPTAWRLLREAINHLRVLLTGSRVAPPPAG